MRAPRAPSTISRAAGGAEGPGRAASDRVGAAQRAVGNGALTRMLRSRPVPPAGGERLPATLAPRLSTELGADLSAVRVHTDLAAQRRARAEGASALTRGDAIFFGRGRYRPLDPAGNRLLRHELAHVLQQRRPGPPAPAATLEREADRVASGGGTTLSPASPAAAPLAAPATVRSVIEDELDDVFFGIDNAWPLIRQAPQAERDLVRHDPTIEKGIRRRADPMDLLKTYLLLAFQTEDSFPAHYAAFIDATDRAGTHEARIFSILRGVTQAEREHMSLMPGFAEVLDDELSRDELTLATRLLHTGEAHGGTARSTARSSTRLESGKRWDLVLDARGSLEQVQSNFHEVIEDREETKETILNDISLWAVLADEFDPEEVWYLRMLARYGVPANFPRADKETRPFAQVIWEAVEGVGTKEDELVDELTLVHLSTGWAARGGNVLFSPPEDEVKDEPWFVPMLESELSGKDLGRALAAVSAVGTADDPNRDALEDAIDDHDVPRMNKLILGLSTAERQRLANDPVILDELGEELSGLQLCDVALLLTHGRAGAPQLVKDLLAFFRKSPADVPGAVAFLTGLAAPDQQTVREEPGVYFMLTKMNNPALLAAIRSHDPLWQIPGSEGTHRATTSRVVTELPVTFAGSEVRVNVRFDLDVSNLPDDKKPKSKVLESWTREIDRVWNGRFRVRSGTRRLDLVFNAYFAVGLAPPNVPVVLDAGHGRASANFRGMNIFLEGLPGESGVPAVTIAHEFGHVVGNPDEYALTPADYARFAGKPGSTPTPRGGQGVKGLMSDQKASTEIGERHMGPVLEIINLVRDVMVFPDPFVLEKV